ncbi:uncharacterized protein LOC123559232 [Mercenaria mercenaria]|uniref:uncharacterized protein LOC123559232 n=1 Tax=Mercenaria mercenaria TaxID=6596 RepID=UPI00234F4176|nr:uncharacterized protein LOC123559232 [Mercenaria mercenaria]
MNIFASQLTELCFVYFIGMCLFSVSAYMNGTCSSKVIGRKETACFAQYNLTDAFVDGLPQPAALTYFTHNMVNLCGNLINITSCLEEAMSPCKNPYFDFGSYRNTLQKICLNRKLFSEAEIYCEMTDTLTTCVSQYHKEVQELKYHIYLDQSEIPLGDFCTVLRNTGNCIHINETRDCIRVRSEFLTSLYRGRFMPSVCSNKPDDAMNGSGRIHLLALCYIFLLYFST